MNAFRTDRCCRAACARIADAMGLRPYVVTHASYRDLQGGRVAADSMIAETLEVRTRRPDLSPWLTQPLFDGVACPEPLSGVNVLATLVCYSPFLLIAVPHTF